MDPAMKVISSQRARERARSNLNAAIEPELRRKQ